MRLFKVIVTVACVSAAFSQVAFAQSAPGAAQPVVPGFNFPPELAAKKLSDDALKAANGNFQALIQTVPDKAQLPSVTEGFLLANPSALPQIVSFAAQAGGTEEASAIGLGLCTTTSSLMTAADNPQANPAQSQAARDFARSILSGVAAASQSNAQLNLAISSSFGISVNPNGSMAVTCKAVNGEVVATTAVSAAAAGSNAGVGAAVNSEADGGARVGLNGPQTRGGGAARHVAFAGSASPSTFTTNDVITATIQVPSPEAGAGFVSTIGLLTMLVLQRVRRSRGGASAASI